MGIEEKINVVEEEIRILETGFAGIIHGSLVDMRNHPDFISTDKDGLIEKEYIDDFLSILKKELNKLVKTSKHKNK